MKSKENAVTWIVLCLIIIRIVMVLGLVQGFPLTPYHQGWYLHHGGDQVEYFTIARTLIDRGAVDSFRPFGYPLTLVPFILCYDAHSWETILMPAVFFNAFYLFALSIILVALITLSAYKNRAAAVLSALIWVLLPYLIWQGTEWILSVRHPDRLGSPGPEIWMVHQMWANMLSDPMATFMCILIFFLFIRDAGREKGWALPILFGVLAAFAMSVRYSNVVLLPAGMLIYLAARRFRKMLWFFISLIAMFLPIFIYHQIHGLNPLSFINYQGVASYSYGALKWIYIPSTGRYFFQILPFPAFLAFCLLVLSVLWGLFWIFKHSIVSGAAILLWITLFLGFYLSYDGLFRDLPRFLMPLYPPLIICFSVALTDLGERIIRLFKKGATPLPR